MGETNKPKTVNRICFIAPSLQMGGIERAMTTFANYYSSKGLEVYYITLFPFEPFFELDDKVKLHAAPYAYPRTGRSACQTVRYYVRMLSPLNGHIKKEIKKIKPEAVLCFGDWFPHLVMLQLKSLNVPLFYSNRSNPKIKYSSLQELFRKTAYAIAPPAGIIAQTTAAEERKRRLLQNRVPIKVVPNPVREISGDDMNKENWIISVGRLHLEKGFVRLMEAFKNTRHEGWKLVLVGSGMHEREIKDKAADLGIANEVIFTGKVRDVDTLLLRSRIFVLSSHNEGYPNALCEAMSAGLACVSFDIVAGPRDIIKNGENGFLVPDGDLISMSDRIEELIDDENLRKELGENARKITYSNSIEIIGDKVLRFISENAWK